VVYRQSLRCVKVVFSKTRPHAHVHTPRCRKQRVTRLNAVESCILAETCDNWGGDFVVLMLQSSCFFSQTSAAASAAKVLPVFNSTERPGNAETTSLNRIWPWGKHASSAPPCAARATRESARHMHTLKASPIALRSLSLCLYGRAEMELHSWRFPVNTRKLAVTTPGLFESVNLCQM
jgi:hypothetical protein